MSGAPLFSIVIPTRNRPLYLQDAIASVLEQTFEDFELIVSDNSDEKEQKENQDIVARYKDDRLRYVRPPHVLNMTAHWNWALNHPTGRYIGVVTDRMALRLYALDRIAEVFKETGANVVCYRSHNTRETQSSRTIRVDTRKSYRSVQSAEKIQHFSEGKLPKDTPRLLNSFASRGVFQKMTEKYGTPLGGAAPDYSFTFRVLADLASFIFLDEALLVVQGEQSSNGKALSTGRPNKHSQDFKERLVREQARELQFGLVPNDTTFLPNLIIREYCIVADDNPRNAFPPPDHKSIYANAVEFAKRQARSGLLPDEIKQVLDIYRDMHGFEKADIPPNRKTRKLKTAINMLRSMIDDLSIARAIKSPLYFSAARIGLGQKLSGTNLMDVLKQDLALHEKPRG